MQKFWPVLYGSVLAAEFLLFVLAPFVGWWLPANYCSFGPSVDNLFYLILAITGATFVGTMIVFVWALLRYAARPGEKSQYTHGSHKLEMVWTAVPAVTLLFIAFAQVKAWEHIKYVSRMPEPDQVFEVSARQFEWRMRYPQPKTMDAIVSEWKKENKEPASARDWERNRHFDDVHVVNDIHTWKGAKVRLYLKSRDVIHSFFLPNMRIKQDALPGKVIPVWFDCDESNCSWDDTEKKLNVDRDKTWELACAELCGWGHYRMHGRVYVHPDKADYERWLANEWARQNTHQRQPQQ
ncbi:MAG TPA: cytochrome c oxidase subunit II [Gemmataceae bacterium]|nr:cytochrome c oxidase subunit II [Gemmataceae bacterium]